jgi:hypothetical protein
MDNPQIGRIVTFLSPVIAAVTLAVVNAVQDWFGIALDGTQLSVLLTGSVVGVLSIVFKWLDNRGKYERNVEFGFAGPPPTDQPKK